jgi:hypothetical protein
MRGNTWADSMERCIMVYMPKSRKMSYFLLTSYLHVCTVRRDAVGSHWHSLQRSLYAIRFDAKSPAIIYT